MTDALKGSLQFGLADKVVVITGAAGGIGAAIARAFARAGSKIALIDLEAAACADLLDELRGMGAEAVAIACNVGQEDSVKAAADSVASSLGPADVLINNAAILQAGSIEDIEISQWQAVINVNLTGYLLCARSFGAQMKAKGGGTMVHTGSVSGRHPQAFSGAYSVSKAGAHMLSKLIAVEWGPYNIRSNTVCPAMVVTPMSEAFYKDPDIKARREAMVPSGRAGQPEDIAQAALWLASPLSHYVNGEELHVDGALQKNLLSLIPRPGFSRETD